MLNRVCGLVVLIAFIGLTAGCEMMEGFGKDMEKGGEKIQDKAKENK